MYPLRHIHNRRSTASGDYSVEQPGDLRETPRMVSRAPSVYRSGSERGRPNDGSTRVSKWVIAATWSPVRVRTSTPVARRRPSVGERR
jgi:hypothetical protein